MEIVLYVSDDIRDDSGHKVDNQHHFLEDNHNLNSLINCDVSSYIQNIKKIIVVKRKK